MSRRLRIGTCADTADAALVRSVFAARGIPVVIGAEHHASLLGPIGSSFLSLDIWVAEEDAEDAAALLRDLREHPADAALADDFDPGAPETTDGNPAEAEATATLSGKAETTSSLEPEAGATGEWARAQLDQRRRTGIAILLGCLVTFGTAHLYTRAWLRGIALAVVEAIGFRYVGSGHRIGPTLVVAAVIYDLIGALWRIRHMPSTALPVAQLRRR